MLASTLPPLLKHPTTSAPRAAQHCPLPWPRSFLSHRFLWQSRSRDWGASRVQAPICSLPPKPRAGCGGAHRPSGTPTYPALGGCSRVAPTAGLTPESPFVDLPRAWGTWPRPPSLTLVEEGRDPAWTLPTATRQTGRLGAGSGPASAALISSAGFLCRGRGGHGRLSCWCWFLCKRQPEAGERGPRCPEEGALVQAEAASHHRGPVNARVQRRLHTCSLACLQRRLQVGRAGPVYTEETEAGTKAEAGSAPAQAPWGSEPPCRSALGLLSKCAIDWGLSAQDRLMLGGRTSHVRATLPPEAPGHDPSHLSQLQAFLDLWMHQPTLPPSSQGTGRPRLSRVSPSSLGRTPAIDLGFPKPG